MPLPLIAVVGIQIGITLLVTALSYLFRPHQKKSPFQSATYGLQGPVNSYEPGTPLNVAYGTIELPPAILNWYRRGNSGRTRAYFIGSLGHGQIGGVRGVKLNGLGFSHYYGKKSNKDAQIYITHGEYQQKVYKFCKEVIGYLSEAPTGTSPKMTLTVVVSNGRTFQTASAKEPGYLLLYGQNTDTGGETYEMVRYLSATVDGSTWTFKGVRMTKTFLAADNVKQFYKIVKDDANNAVEVIPHIGSITTFHQDIASVPITNSWSQTFTTHGKVDAFSTTFDFPEGLYKINKGKVSPNQVTIAVRWAIAGSNDWSGDPIYVETPLSETEYKINVTKNTNYAILCDTSGNEITAADGSYDYLDNIDPGMEIEFSKGVSVTYRYYIASIFTESTGEYTSLGYPAVRGKIMFKSRIKPSVDSSPKYSGADITAATYVIYYQVNSNENSALITIPETAKAIQGSYQTTYQFPLDGLSNEKKMSAYKQYDIQYKFSPDLGGHDTSKDAHKTVITSIEDITMDDLTYPGEALIAMRLVMTEKINGTLDNITAIVDGMLVKDTSEDNSSVTQWAANFTFSGLLVDGDGQPIRRRAINNSSKDCKHVYRLIKTGTTGAIEPNWLPLSGAIIFDGTCEWQEDSCKWNDNALDIVCDLQQNKLYGRGQYLDFDNTILSDLYSSYNVADSNNITDRQYVEHVITENSKARKRLSVNVNMDFRQPLIDTLEVFAKSTRAYNYWDGQKLLTYIDRYRAPVTMINNANIIPYSFVINEVNVEDKINRIYASILNRYRQYKQDQVGRDYIDEGFAINDLVMEQIHLYGLTDKWHATKILSYILKYSQYIKHIIAFEQGMDACVYDVGDVFYFSNEATNNSLQIGTAKKWSSTCGRVIAVSGATFTVDKDVTITNGQKVLLRTSTGGATEYTINSQIGRVITCGASITSVSVNSIYSLGTADSNNEYYRLFTCVLKKPKEYSYEIVAITYDDNIFKDIYSTATPSQETSSASISIAEENDELNQIDFSKSPPPPITHAIVKEDPLVQGEAVIYITRPISGNWGYAEIYFKDIESEEWRFAGKTTGDPIRVNGLVAGEIYEYQIKSYSTDSIAADTKIHGTFVYGEDSNSIDLPRPTGFQIANRMGTLGDVYGRGFRFRWDDMTSQTKESLTYAMRKAGYEQIKYYLEIYFSAIPTTVKIGNTNVKDMIARHETLTDNKFNYDYEDTMEDISKIFEKYSTHSSYNTYYNVPQRTIKAKLYCINNYSKKSSPAELTLTNPAPGAYLSDGSTKITPTLKKLKSGVRVSFPHPYDSNGDEEYDLSHAIVQRCENSNFTGTTLKKRKVMSSITVNSNDEDVADTSYQEDFKGLDPKKTYYFRLIFYDVFGTSTDTTSISATANIVPGVTDDDEEDAEEQIKKPQQPTGLSLTINSNNNVILKWNAPSSDADGNHATDTIKVIIDYRARQGVTGTPSLFVRPDGDIPSLVDVDNGYFGADTATLVIGEKKSIERNIDETETYNKHTFVIKGAKVGYTYFARVRFENSSRKQSLWSVWGYNTTAVSGLSSDDFDYDFKKFVFDGTFSASDIDTVAWSTGTLKFKNTNGSTTDYSISNAGNTGNMTEAMWIVWPGDTPNANTKFKALTSAQYLAATGKTPMAFAQKGDTGQVAFYARFSDKKDFMVNASFIAAGSIITAHLAALSVEASKMNINGTLTMGHSSGAKMLFLDNSSVNRIKIAATNGGEPKLIITKSGSDADTETNPDNIRFSTTYNYFKIIESELPTTVNFSYAAAVTTGSIYHDDVTNAYTLTNDSIIMGLITFMDFGGYMRMLPITDYTSATQWETYELIHDSGASPYKLRFRRTIYNMSGGNWTPGARTKKFNWFLIAQTLGV